MRVALLAAFSMLPCFSALPDELPPPPLPAQITSEHNAARRLDLALDMADQALDQARLEYQKDNFAGMTAQLDMMRGLVDDALHSAEELHKSKSFKRTEMKVGALVRRVRSFADDLSYDQRDQANALATHLESVHDKLLAGVMKK